MEDCCCWRGSGEKFCQSLDDLDGTKPTLKPNSRPILFNVSNVGFAAPASISATWRLVSESVLANSSWVMPKPFRMSATAPGSLSTSLAPRLNLPKAEYRQDDTRHHT